ncbi:MAG: linear amide C-N hydrolase [Planctomycetota bacterium]|nr:linear amide C-N hydrolase [Planctomycetota bacterium]
MIHSITRPLLGLLALTMGTASLLACTRVLWNTGGHPLIAARNMDWINSMPVDFYALPRGIDRNGLVGPKSVQWKSKHGMLALVRDGAGVVDGINEKGLAGHMLWLGTTDYGTRDPQRPGISLGLWLQYCLDNFATAAEVATAFEKDPFQIVPANFDGLKTSTHLAIEDTSGDSVVIEYQAGKPRVFHGRQHTVMTNDPPFAKQLENLRLYQGFGGKDPLPGTNLATDRFVRAAHYLRGLPQPKNDREAIAYVFSVMRNVSQPFGEVNLEALRKGDPHNSPTRWRSVINLTNGQYFYESTLDPNVLWVNMRELDFSPVAGIRKLSLQGSKLVGDSTQGFKPSNGFSVLIP